MWDIKLPPPQGWVATSEMFSEEQMLLVEECVTELSDASVGDITRKQVVRERRSSKVGWIHPSEKSQPIFELIEDGVYQLNKFFRLRLTGIENLQYTEYDAEYEGHFTAHIDEPYGVPNEHPRKLSMVLQLSNDQDYDGGDLLLYPQSLNPVTVPRMRGQVVFFRSRIVHKVTPITRGKRKSLVAWISGPEGEL